MCTWIKTVHVYENVCVHSGKIRALFINVCVYTADVNTGPVER